MSCGTQRHVEVLKALKGWLLPVPTCRRQTPPSVPSRRKRFFRFLQKAFSEPEKAGGIAGAVGCFRFRGHALGDAPAPDFLFGSGAPLYPSVKVPRAAGLHSAAPRVARDITR